MKILLMTLMVFLGVSSANAEVVSENGDWIGEKDIMTVLGKEGCVAQTTVEEADDQGTVTNTFRLQIIKLKASNGDYSAPIVVSLPDTQLTDAYFEGIAKTDRSPEFSLTLLQPTAGSAKIVGSRYGERIEITRRIRRDNRINIGFKNKDAVVKDVRFSLRGSSATIRETTAACQ